MLSNWSAYYQMYIRYECESDIVLLFFMVASVCVRVKAALGVWILVTQVTIESERCEGHCTMGSQADITHNISKKVLGNFQGLQRIFPMDIRSYFCYQVSFGPIYTQKNPLIAQLNWGFRSLLDT